MVLGPPVLSLCKAVGERCRLGTATSGCPSACVDSGIRDRPVLRVLKQQFILLPWKSSFGPFVGVCPTFPLNSHCPKNQHEQDYWGFFQLDYLKKD